MMCFLLFPTIRTLFNSLYSSWIGATSVTWMVWPGPLTDSNSVFARTGVTVILVLLLIGGVVLFVVGIRDLIRDFRRFLRLRSEKKPIT